MATSGRGMGTGKNQPPASFTWSSWRTPGGKEYWTRSDDPGFGYLDDPEKEGLQPSESLRYPLSLIHFTWNGPTSNDRDATGATKVSQQVRELTASALEGRVTVPYGRVRVAGNVIAWRGVGSLLYTSLSLCQGPISAFVGVNMLEQAASLSGGAPFGGDALFQTELGLANPVGAVPSYYGLATNAQGVERFPFLATAHCRFNMASTTGLAEAAFPLFTIDGRTLRDPRLGMDGDDIPDQPEAFSKNVSLALADYYTSKIYGIGRDDDRIYWDSVAEVANDCDVLVAGLPRHTINWAIMRQSTHRDIVDTIKLLGRIKVIRRDGKLVFRSEKARLSVHTFTPADSRPIEAEKVSLAVAPNMIKGTFTNPLKDYSDDTVWAKTEAARTGAEPPYIQEVQLEGLDNASEAQRQVNWLLDEIRNPLRVTFEGTKADAQQYEPVDRVGYYSPTAKLGVSEADPQDLTIIATQLRDTGTVVFHCKLYDEGYFSDAVRDTESPPINTTAPPTQAPDPPTSPAAAASLTIGDGLTLETFSPIGGLIRSGNRIKISWAHPGWPYTLKYRVTAQRSGGGVEFPIGGLFDASPAYFDASNEQLTYTFRVYALIPSTGATSTAVSGAVTIGVAAPQPPGEFFGDITDGWYWNAPPLTRPEVALTAGMFSGTNMTTLVTANLVDDNESTTAAQFGVTGTTRSLVLDLGAGPPSVAEVEWIIGGAGITAAFEDWGISGGAVFPSSEPPILYYADTLGTWTQIDVQMHPIDQTFKKFIWQIPAAQRGHRYLKWEKSSGSASYTKNITEIRAYTFSGTATDVAGYIVTKFIGRDPGDIIQWQEANINWQPSSSLRIPNKDIWVRVRDRDLPLGGYLSGADLRVAFVQTVSSAGVASVARMLYNVTIFSAAPANATGVAQNWVPQTQNSITLANGLNSNIVVSLGPGAQSITGPTAAFTLGGFVAPLSPATSPIMVVAYAGSQQVFIANEDAGSTAANRITTMTGASTTVLRGPCEAVFRYDPTVQRWRPIALYDGTFAYKNGDVVMVSAATADRFISLGEELTGGPAFNFGYTGSSFGRGSGFINVRPDATATPPNPSLRIFIANVEAVRIDNTRNMGALTSLSVAGGSKLSALLTGSTTWNPLNLSVDDEEHTDVTVTGAVTTDEVLAISFTSLTSEKAFLRGRVSAANTVTVYLLNASTTTAYDLVSGTLKVVVGRFS